MRTRNRREAAVAGLRVSPHLYMRKCGLDQFVDALLQVVRFG